MKPVLNHVALNVTDFDWYKNFFETVCEMQSYQAKGEAPVCQKDTSLIMSILLRR